MYRVGTSHGHCIQMKLLLSAGNGTNPVVGSGSAHTWFVGQFNSSVKPISLLPEFVSRCLVRTPDRERQCQSIYACRCLLVAMMLKLEQ